MNDDDNDGNDGGGDRTESKSLTFFCLNLIASFKRFKCILSPCSKAGPVGS